jgi:hypothetical protein
LKRSASALCMSKSFLHECFFVTKKKTCATVVE